MPEQKRQRNYRFTERTLERIEKLQNRMALPETYILETAIGHLLGSLERDQAVWITVPSEPQQAHNDLPSDE